MELIEQGISKSPVLLIQEKKLPTNLCYLRYTIFLHGTFRMSANSVLALKLGVTVEKQSDTVMIFSRLMQEHKVQQGCKMTEVPCCLTAISI